MTWTLRIQPEAEADVHEAFQWYESCRTGLGLEFLTAVEATLARMSRDPHVFAWANSNVQRAPVRRFPYGVFYHMDDDAIIVVAIVHAKRRPSIWKRRKPSR